MKTYRNSCCEGWTTLTSELRQARIIFHNTWLDLLFVFLCSPPFTIQRVCELVMEPRQHYKRRDKYMRAMEKVRWKRGQRWWTANCLIDCDVLCFFSSLPPSSSLISFCTPSLLSLPSSPSSLLSSPLSPISSLLSLSFLSHLFSFILSTPVFPPLLLSLSPHPSTE